MEPITIIEGSALPVDRSDVDTDQIIPAQYLKRVERTGFGPFLFDEWRKDPNFVMNDARYDGASILLAGPNFGCGSSREHAPWAIEDAGFKAVIAPSFADIFRNNCTKVGLVPVTVDLERLALAAPALGLEVPFPLDQPTQQRFLEGLDDIALSLRHDADIARYEATRPGFKPSVAAV